MLLLKLLRNMALHAVGAAHSRCAHRRPYHLLMTSAGDPRRAPAYLEWQARIAHYHYRKLKFEQPCSDLGGFTRLLATPGAKPDALVAEIPTVVVRALGYGSCAECDHGFVVLNRPWALLQYARTAAYREMEESYIFTMETDHLLMRPPPNRATETTPAAFAFYYMTYK